VKNLNEIHRIKLDQRVKVISDYSKGNRFLKFNELYFELVNNVSILDSKTEDFILEKQDYQEFERRVKISQNLLGDIIDDNCPEENLMIFFLDSENYYKEDYYNSSLMLEEEFLDEFFKRLIINFSLVTLISSHLLIEKEFSARLIDYTEKELDLILKYLTRYIDMMENYKVDTEIKQKTMRNKILRSKKISRADTKVYS